MKNLLLVGVCLVIPSLGGCSVSEATVHVPTAEATLPVASGIPVSKVFDCAQKELLRLGERDDLWNHEVTLLDAQAGTLETGEFGDDNVTGFRLRLSYLPRTGAVEIALKGAGAYFVDLGVDDALSEFRQGFERCLKSGL